MNDNELPIIREWYNSQDEMRRAKKHEGELRQEVMKMAFGDEVQTKGTKKQKLPNDMELVLTVPQKITVDKEQLTVHYAAMKARGLIGDDSLISFEPKVNARAYAYMTEEDKAAFGSVLKFGLGSPSMKVEKKNNV